MGKKRDYVNHLVSRLEKPRYKPEYKWLRKNITAIMNNYQISGASLKEQAERIVKLAECVSATYESRYE